MTPSTYCHFQICLIGAHQSKFGKTLRIYQMTGKITTVRAMGGGEGGEECEERKQFHRSLR